MKKKKLLSIALTLALVFTMCFAGAGSAFAADSTVQIAKEVTASDYNDFDTSAEYGYIEYSSTPYVLDVKTPKKGAIVLSMILTANSTITVTDENGSYLRSSYSAVEASTSETDYKYYYFTAPAAGTYKVSFSSQSAAKAAVGAYYMAAGGTLKSGKELYGASPNGKVSYYKITAPGTGYLTIDIPHGYDDPASYQVKLLNSKKKALFKKGYEYLNSSKDYTTYTGVTKGTYYIAVKTNDIYYGINVKYTRVSENSGSKKSAAKSIKKGKTKSGIITAKQSSSSGDWYKFVVSKSQEVNFEITTKSSQGGNYGGLKVSFYSGKTSYPFFSTTYNSTGTTASTVNLFTNYSSKLAAGTYYIKVQKYDDGNGYYKIKWQK